MGLTRRCTQPLPRRVSNRHDNFNINPKSKRAERSSVGGLKKGSFRRFQGLSFSRLSYPLINYATGLHKQRFQSTAPPEALRRGSPLAIDVSPFSSPSKSAGGFHGSALRMVLNKEETKALPEFRTHLERIPLQLSEETKDLQKAASGLAALTESCKKLTSPAAESGSRERNAAEFEDKILSIKRKLATVEHTLKTEESRQKNHVLLFLAGVAEFLQGKVSFTEKEKQSIRTLSH
jgi:hypothetical protein